MICNLCEGAKNEVLPDHEAIRLNHDSKLDFLCTFLKQNIAGVTHIYLQNNNFQDESTKAISEALKSNFTIKALILRWPEICEEGMKALEELLIKNWTITAIDWSDLMHITGKERERKYAIEYSLKVNRTVAKTINQQNIKNRCATIAFGLACIPVYLLLDILNIDLVLNLEIEIRSSEFRNENSSFQQFLRSTVSPKHLLNRIDKIKKMYNKN